MAALRWILLLAGVVFLGALTIWELRRPRQARADESAPEHKRSEPALAGNEAGAAGPFARPAARVAGAALTAEGRHPLQPPVQIDLPPQEPHDEDSARAAIDALPVFDYRLDAAQPTADEPLIEPLGPALGEPDPGPAAQDAARTGDAELVIDWPPEGRRHIVSLRIVSGPQEQRLSGRAVRLAIAASGFVHGRFGIYHQPGLDGRSLLSIASLNKPGILDPSNLDFQRLAGISLFTVLPGPLPPAAALDHLLDTARDLSERLHAQLQDENGHALDANRLETLRESMQRLDAEPAA
jgi:FtsZ-interacting cell division protein ZipA